MKPGRFNLEYNVSLILELDSDIVNNVDVLKGTSMTVNDCSIAIKSYQGDMIFAGSLVYENDIYELSIDECFLDANTAWFLTNKHGNDSDFSRVTYEDLKDGAYDWDVQSATYISFFGQARNVTMGDEIMLEVRMDISDATKIEYQWIEVTKEDECRQLMIKRVRM